MILSLVPSHDPLFFALSAEEKYLLPFIPLCDLTVPLDLPSIRKHKVIALERHQQFPLPHF